MTLRDQILAVAATNPAVAAGLAARDMAAIAAAMPPRIEYIEHLIGVGTILSMMGAQAGAAMLDVLDAAAASSPPLKWGLKLLIAGTLNVGSQAFRDQADALVAATLMPADVAVSLKALGEAHIPYAERDCMLALYDDSGNWLGN